MTVHVSSADLDRVENKVDGNYRELKGKIESLEGRMVRNHRELRNSLDRNHQELKNILRDGFVLKIPPVSIFSTLYQNASSGRYGCIASCLRWPTR